MLGIITHSSDSSKGRVEPEETLGLPGQTVESLAWLVSSRQIRDIVSKRRILDKE